MPKDKEELKEEKDKKNKKIQTLEEELAKLKADVDHWKNEYYRAYADTKNLRNNLEKEHSDIIKYRAMGFIEDLLPVLVFRQTTINPYCRQRSVRICLYFSV